MQPEVKWIMEYLDSRPILPEITLAAHEAMHWSFKDHGYTSKNARILEWMGSLQEPRDCVFYEILCHIFAGVILDPQGMTYQAMIGYISGNIGCAHPLDRAKCAAEIIAIAYQCDLIVITKTSEKTMIITTEYVLDEDVPDFPKHAPLFRAPEPGTVNPILGNQFKQHDQDVCLGHINRMNALPLVLEQRLITGLEETTSEVFETQEQKVQWEDFKRRSHDMYEKVGDQTFWLSHSYDTRGRCYCSGYYINYQGSSYKKAIVQLAEKETVKL